MVLTTSALSIREQLVGSLAARISYTVPLAESGLVGLIKADVQPIWGTSLAVNTSSALQWDLSAQNTGVITLGSDATSVKLGRGSSPLVQPESLWTLSSRCEYGSGSFHATASETVSNSLVDTSGRYSFQDSKNWYVSFSLIFFNKTCF